MHHSKNTPKRLFQLSTSYGNNPCFHTVELLPCHSKLTHMLGICKLRIFCILVRSYLHRLLQKRVETQQTTQCVDSKCFKRLLFWLFTIKLFRIRIRGNLWQSPHLKCLTQAWFLLTTWTQARGHGHPQLNPFKRDQILVAANTVWIT